VNKHSHFCTAPPAGISTHSFLLLISLFLPILSHPTNCSGESFTLKDCISRAHQNNPDLAAIRSATQEANTLINTSKSQLGPTVSLGLQSKVQSVVPEMNQPAVTISTPAGDLFIPGRSLKLGSNDSYSLDLDINQVLFAGGRLDGAVVESEMTAGLASERERLFLSRLDAQVSYNFLSLGRLLELQAISLRALELAKKHGEDIHNLFAAGAVVDNEVLKADLRISEAESALISAGLQVRLQAERLRSITGWNFEMPTRISIPALGNPELPSIEKSTDKAGTGRVELAVFDRQLQINRQELTLIQNEKMPVVSVFGRASYGKPGLDFIKNEWSDSFVAGLQVSFSAYDNHRRSSRELTKSATIVRIEAERKAALENIRLEVTKAVMSIEDMQRRLEVAKRAEGQAQENFRITSDRFSAGSLTNTDYLDAEIALDKSSTSTVLAEADLDQAWIDYFQAVGADFMKENWE
jgi:outer membrane protein